MMYYRFLGNKEKRMDEIKMKDCRFFVDEEKRTVACVIDHTRGMFENYINDELKMGGFISFAYVSNTRVYNSLKMPPRFTGVAHCSLDDTWNVETGKLIAFKRAKEKLYGSFFRHANTFMNEIDKVLDRSEVQLNRMGEKVSRNLDHLDKVIEDRVGTAKNE